MYERANSAGALFKISSQVNGGTRLQLTWQNPKQEEKNV